MTILDLDIYIIYYIIAKLSLRDIILVGRTNHLFYKILFEDKSFWRIKYFQDFNGHNEIKDFQKAYFEKFNPLNLKFFIDWDTFNIYYCIQNIYYNAIDLSPDKNLNSSLNPITIYNFNPKHSKPILIISDRSTVICQEQNGELIRLFYKENNLETSRIKYIFCLEIPNLDLIYNLDLIPFPVADVNPNIKLI